MFLVASNPAVLTFFAYSKKLFLLASEKKAGTAGYEAMFLASHSTFIPN